MGLESLGVEKVAARPLQFIWILDCSGSMQGEKIQQLNFAIRDAIPAMQDVASENINAEVLVRAVRFSSGAQWHIAVPTPVESFEWQDLDAIGVTDMGRAFALVAEQLNTNNMPDRGLPPVLVLISDGEPTDEYKKGLDDLMSKPWAKKAARIAIAIGQDANTDVLQEFIGNTEIKPLQANNAKSLVNYIKWVSTQVLKSVSAPSSQTNDAASAKNNVSIPMPADSDLADAEEVW